MITAIDLPPDFVAASRKNSSSPARSLLHRKKSSSAMNLKDALWSGAVQDCMLRKLSAHSGITLDKPKNCHLSLWSSPMNHAAVSNLNWLSIGLRGDKKLPAGRTIIMDLEANRAIQDSCSGVSLDMKALKNQDSAFSDNLTLYVELADLTKISDKSLTAELRIKENCPRGLCEITVFTEQNQTKPASLIVEIV